MYTTLYPFGKLNFKAAMLVPMLLLSMFTMIPIVTSQVVPNIGKISPTLLNEMANAGESVNVLIKTFSNDYSSVVKQINTLGGQVGCLFKYVNGLSASLPASKVVELTQNSLVERIYYDAKRKLAGSSESLMGPRTLDELDALMTKPTVMNSREYMPVSLKSTDLASIEPNNYWNPTAMGAEPIWEETNMGAGSLVVIIDTGIWRDHFLFAGTDIIGGVDMSYDVDNPMYEGWSNPYNNPHGSHVAGIVASTGGIVVPPTEPLAEAIERYTGTPLPPGDPYGYPGWKVIWLLGMAPYASLYIVKVFDHTGEAIPETMVMAGMEHALDLKLTYGYDVDAISMSISGPTVYDGRDLEDQLVDTITSHGITLVAAASNDGPATMTVGSPGSAYTTITAGAAATPVQTRVYWDYYYGWPGIGYYLYTTEDTQIYAFSSRGPTSDGRSKPTLSATGIFVLSAYTEGGAQDLAWFSGTSMATPAVSGAVALLNAFAETAGGRWKKLEAATPEDYKQALMNGAVWLPGYTEWDQGAGFLNAANALEALKNDNSIGDVAPPLPPTGELIDITNIPLVGEGTYSTSISNLAPGHKVEYIFKVTRATEWIKLDVTNVNRGAFNPLRLNSFEVYIQSAKRTYYAYYIDSANVFGNCWFKILDDKTTWSGAVSGVFWDDYTRVIEPGYMKIVVENDWTSADLMSGDIKITARAAVEETPDLTITGSIEQGDWIPWTLILVPAGTKNTIIELRWVNDWTQYPTSDLDLYVYWNEGYNFKGVTLSAPERVVLDKATFFYIGIDGYSVHVPAEPFELLVWFQ